MGDSIEWMAALVSHIPDRGGQTVRYLDIIVMSQEAGLKKKMASRNTIS